MTHTQTSADPTHFQPLHEAFQAGNELFERLTESYQGLEGQVAALTAQLGNAAHQQSKMAASPYSDDVILAMASLAHQIRSPLMVAGVYAEQLKSCREDQKEFFFDRLNRSLRDLGDQLEELMQMAKRAQGLEQEFVLNDFVQSLIEDAQAWFLPSAGSIQWSNAVGDSKVSCKAKSQALLGAIRNVLHNAANSKNTPVSIGCEFRRSSSGQLVIQITDDGDGLAESEKQQLFIPYASSRKGGHGLGLCFARHIAQAHGGDLNLVYTSPKGSCFEFTLPIFCSPNSCAHQHNVPLG